jgi:hypothetical protein
MPQVLILLIVLSINNVSASQKVLRCNESASIGMQWVSAGWKPAIFPSKSFELVLDFEKGLITNDSIALFMGGAVEDAWQYSCSKVNEVISCKSDLFESLVFNPETLTGSVSIQMGNVFFVDGYPRDSLQMSAFSCHF